MPQQIGWSQESKLLYELKQQVARMSGAASFKSFPSLVDFPTPGDANTIYLALDTSTIYYWDETTTSYVSMGGGGGGGISEINGLTDLIQFLSTGTTGTDFGISSVANTHTFNLPTASATNRGALSSTDWTTFNGKQNALTNPITGTGTNNELTYFTGSTSVASLSTATYPSLTELSYVKGVTSGIQTQVNSKQATLVSGTNIKTINGDSLLGSGDITVSSAASNLFNYYNFT